MRIRGVQTLVRRHASDGEEYRKKLNANEKLRNAQVRRPRRIIMRPKICREIKCLISTLVQNTTHLASCNNTEAAVSESAIAIDRERGLNRAWFAARWREVRRDVEWTRVKINEVVHVDDSKCTRYLGAAGRRMKMGIYLPSTYADGLRFIQSLAQREDIVHPYDNRIAGSDSPRIVWAGSFETVRDRTILLCLTIYEILRKSACRTSGVICHCLTVRISHVHACSVQCPKRTMARSSYQ